MAILIVDDDARQRELVANRLGSHRSLQASNANEALAILQHEHVDLLITDLVLPERDGWSVIRDARQVDPQLPVIVISGHRSVENMERAIEAGALGFFAKAWGDDNVQRKLDVAIKRGLELTRLHRNAEAGKARIKQARVFESLIGHSPGMRRIKEQIEQYSESDQVILIQGETGAGKEIVAKAFHASSRYTNGPFVDLHVASVTPQLVPAALFGHVKGAFTGATEDSMGAFESANHGTLFLDEIGELRTEAQVALLGGVPIIV